MSWIGPLLLLILGARGAFWVVGDTRRIVASSGWSAGEATVVRSSITSSRGRHGSRLYSPDVEYRYTVNGSSYVGSRLEIPPRRDSSEVHVRKRLAPYAPGTSIRILYDPAEPAESVVLAPEMNWSFTVGLGGLSAALLAGGLFAIGSRSSRG